jgi:hypothetical protein
VMEPPVQVLSPLTARFPFPAKMPPEMSKPAIPALNDRIEVPLLMIALSLSPGTPEGDQFVALPQSPVPPNHVRSVAKCRLDDA